MSYKTDINDYVIFQGDNVTNYGASTSETPENNYAAMAAALAAGKRIMRFGEEGETYIISQPIYVPEGMTIVVNCKIKIKDGLTTTVTSDVAQGATSFDVTNPEYFNVGEWIAITDDAQFAGYATLRGSSGRITDITGSTITFDSVCSYAYATAENAIAAHCSSVLMFHDVDDCKAIFTGTAEIDGNKANQEQIHTVRNIAVIEDQRAGCGIVIYKCDNIILEKPVVRDCLMHNISINGHDGTAQYYNTNIELINPESYDGHDKNVLVRDIDGFTLTGKLITEGAVWEDGLMFYTLCKNITVNEVEANDCKRAGLYWNSAQCEGLIVNKLTTSGNGRGLYITAKDAVINDVTSSDIALLSNVYNNADNIVVNGLTITGAVGTNILQLSGNVRNSTINDLVITGCTGVGIKCDSDAGTPSDPPENILIDGGGIYNNTGDKFSIEGGTDITFTNFENYP